jgi:thioesterase domain-containing protein
VEEHRAGMTALFGDDRTGTKGPDTDATELRSRADKTYSDDRPAGDRRLVNLVLLKPGFSRPLFLVHPIGGTLHCYSGLVRLLPTDQACYGLHASPARSPPARPATVERLATSYLKQILRIQPEGPHLLAGWSFGGVVAYDIARQIEQRGITASVVALFDSRLVHQGGPRDDVDEELIWKHFLAQLGGELSLPAELYGLKIADSEPRLRFDTLARAIGAQSTRAETVPQTADELKGQFAVYRQHLLALIGYRPGPVKGRLIIYEAADGDVTFEGTHANWSDLTSGACETALINGNHFSMLRLPNVDVLAKHLSSQISPAQEQVIHEY